MRNLHYILALISIISIFIGCSGFEKSTTAPGLPGDSEISSTMELAPVIGYDGNSATGVLGAYSLVVSPDETTVELIPLRESSIGESYIVSGSAFFTITPCSDCLRVKSIALDSDGNLVLGFSVSHPFEKGDVLKPPSAINRLDLDVFDLAIVFNPLGLSPTAFTHTSVDVYSGIVQNSDGYTIELNEVLGEIAALPYKICFESMENNRFEMGTVNQEFDVILSPGDNLYFEVYLTMGYGASATKSLRMIPEYFVPEFNRKSAWKVVVTPPEGNDPPQSGNTWDDSDNVTEYPVTIDIYDWNHEATIASIYPDLNNKDHIAAASDVSSVTVEIPGMTNSLASASTSDLTQNGWDDPLTYIALIANELSLQAGEYTGLVKVTDSRIPGTSLIGGETDTLTHSDNGIGLEWFDIPEFATYQTFIATVIEGGSEPDCDINADDDEVDIGTTVNFDPGTSNDPNGTIIRYEYDSDYDGVIFDVDAVQNEGDPDFGDPVGLVMCHSSDVVQIMTVALRVTDNDLLEVICSTDITVHPSPKNVGLRDGFDAIDFGVRMETGEGYVGFNDGQVWIYNEDYSSGSNFYTPAGGAIRYVDVTQRGDIYSITQNNMIFRKYDGSYVFDIPYWNNDTFDVCEIDFAWGTGYFDYVNGGCCMRFRTDVSPYRQLYGRHTWGQQGALSYYPPNREPQDIEGETNFTYLKGIENAYSVDHLWVLEGAPRYEAERMSISGLFTGVTIGLDGGQADDITGFNNPLDITTDINDNVYILDLLSTGQPVVKKYRDDGTSVGMFGDTVSISGTPLRIDSDESDGSIHVLHSNGMSIFTVCEIPD